MHVILWDPEKAKANLEKRGVRFSDAEVALFDPNAISAGFSSPFAPIAMTTFA